MFPLPVKGTPTDQLCGVGKQNMMVPLCPQGGLDGVCTVQAKMKYEDGVVEGDWGEQ